VTLQEKILSPSILQINHTKYIIKTTGGQTNGIRWIMEGSLILVSDFLNSLGRWWGRCQLVLYTFKIARTQNIRIMLQIIRTVTSQVRLLENAKIVLMGIF
jgi:hypothetical protein